MSSFPEIVMRNKNLRDKYYAQFKQIFGISILTFLDLFTGFDIVRFDEKFLQTPDGQSTADCLLERYGQEAHNLISNLIMGA